MANAPNPARIESDTIYALSSGRPPAAIAIVRISGPKARDTLVALSGDGDPIPRMATLSTLRDIAGAEIDRGLTLWFPAPRSVTGEDLVELHLHGGIATVDAALASLAALGLRHAEPGEFTRRSLLNGKVDAGDVEALADLLSAQTDYQRREALGRSKRHRSAALADWSRRLTDIAASIEASIEDERIDGESLELTEAVRHACATIAAEIDSALTELPIDRIRDGARVVIVGRTNAGKSSLFNRLTGRDGAIVTPIPGTTRDALEHSVDFEGYPVTLIDTAGMRATDDVVEQLGIARAETAARDADIVIDLDECGIGHQRRIAISPKADLDIERSEGRLPVSAITGSGVEKLKHSLMLHLRQIFPQSDKKIALEDREVLDSARELLNTIGPDIPLILVAEIVRVARDAFARAGERVGPEPLLDAVYTQFCLGK